MGKGGKNKAFNNPFGELKKLKVEPAQAPAKPKPKPQPENNGPDDESLFLREMGGVARLDSDQRVEPLKVETAALPDDDALALAELESLVRGEGHFDIEDTGDEISGRAPGVQQKVLDDLRRGRVSFHRHIDLHGMSRTESHMALNEFIHNARQDGERCVLVVTGRGWGSPDGVSVLREALPRWLTRAPLHAHVLAFCTAQRHDGGPGAFYVLLRRPGVKPFGVPPGVKD
jgi:DNA-nicking Smr family endonuclease